jgi:pyridoxal phosphate enzyme (YggS family)
MPVAENIKRVQRAIFAAASRAGRSPDTISLIAVSKTFPPELIREAYNAGLRQFGESRVQEFAVKIAALQDLQDTQWHMIGHLQTNKAGKAAELFAAVDSVDSARLAEKLNAEAGKLAKKLEVLIEINSGGESGKSGVSADSSELGNILLSAPKWQNLKFMGLMTVPPFSESAEQTRPYFRKLRELRNHIAARQLPGIAMEVLSMGMSHDFEIAIEEGATQVRVGSSIFGTRPGP